MCIKPDNQTIPEKQNTQLHHVHFDKNGVEISKTDLNLLKPLQLFSFKHVTI